MSSPALFPQPLAWLRHALLVLAIIASTNAQARSTTLVEPPVLPLPAGRTVPQAVEAVKLALHSKSWKLDVVESPTSLIGSVVQSRYLARLRFTVTAAGVQARYHSSINLNYDEDGGEREIHPTYNRWVETLMGRIAENLAKDPAEVAADLAVPAEGDAMSQAQAGKSRPAYLDMPTSNPPPSQPLAAFAKLELLPITHQTEDPDLVLRVEADLQKQLAPVVSGWQGNAKAAGGVLRLQPQLVGVHYVSAGRRIIGFGGGDSWIVMKLRCSDAATGALIAEPQFYQRANQRGARMSFGATDAVMLDRVARLLRDYVLANKDKAVGGPSSLPDDLVAQ